MRAATIRDGEVEVAEHPDPEPGAGEVLVRVRGAGLNGADMRMRKGALPGPTRRTGRHTGARVGRRGGARACRPAGAGALDWPAAGSLAEVFTTARAMERHVLAAFESGALTVPVAETCALDEVARAYERFAAGGKPGKIVLLP